MVSNQEKADFVKTKKEMEAEFITSNQVPAARMRFITEKIRMLVISQSNPAALPQPDSALAFLIPSISDTELFQKNASRLEALGRTLIEMLRP
ncbi:MAG: hypothetical protein LBK52_08000, partial [Deltaproteobacteria bacterium]|jgi:hypothetical protein|nr:hypothetical protein [Deltaproteobacteria bacterium]